MADIFELAAGLLKPQRLPSLLHRGHVPGQRVSFLSADLAQVISVIPGMTWKANIVWYDVSKKLHLYGYQYSYIPSLIHQNILVFRKEPQRKDPKENDSWRSTCSVFIPSKKRCARE